MLSEICNQLCIRMSKCSHKVLGRMAGWLATKANLKVVDANAVLLPKGCRAIPQCHFNVDPAVLNQLKDGNRAILYQAMKNWQAWNERTDNQLFMKNDQWGTKSDPKEWHKNVFPFLTLRTVKAMIADLAQASLLVVDGAWCQPLKAQFSGAEQLTLPLGKDFQQPRKVFTSSIESKNNSSKNRTRKQTTISPRKDAVADFRIPKAPNSADFEIRESREGGNDGHDELYGLPTALVEGWTDTKMSLNDLVAKYGTEQIKATWPKVQGFKSPVAGLRTVLKNIPSPRSAPPPSPAADDIEPDGLFEEVPGNETPALDDDPMREPELTPQQKQLAWAKAHCGPAFYAQLVAELEAEQHANTN